jgi:uncharacterized protein (TIGR00290 family)
MNDGKAVFNWSGGKDSAMALHKYLRQGNPEISCLLTTVNESFDRVSMHGVRTELMDRQAEILGFPLVKVMLPEMPDMSAYEIIMGRQMSKLREEGIHTAVFGDIFLEDLRKYREDKLSQLGIGCMFPIWKVPTKELVGEFIDLGFKAVTVCVDERFLDKSFVGREIDGDFLKDLPANVDPCGENGEFHSFVYDGPIFRKPVEFEKGRIVYRRYVRQGGQPADDGYQSHDPFDTGFWYCDLMP